MSNPWINKKVPLKFSRDDDQIFALNYENLCDSDYLSRLFSNDSTNEGDQTNQNTWMLSPDLTEDVLIFTAQSRLGLNFASKRSLMEDYLTSRCWSAHTELLSKQIEVFGYIAKLVIDKHKNIIPAPHHISAIKIMDSSQLLPRALTCILHVLEKNDKSNTKISTVNTTISLVSQYLRHVFQKSNNREVNDKMLSENHTHIIRTILAKGVSIGLSLVEKKSTYPSEILSSFQLALTSAYTLLKVGYILKNASDILLALSFILAASIAIDEKYLEVESMIKLNTADNGNSSSYAADGEFSAQEKLRMIAKLQDYKTSMGKPASASSGSLALMTNEEMYADRSISVNNLNSNIPTASLAFSKLQTEKEHRFKLPHLQKSHVSSNSSIHANVIVMKSSNRYIDDEFDDSNMNVTKKHLASSPSLSNISSIAGPVGAITKSILPAGVKPTEESQSLCGTTTTDDHCDNVTLITGMMNLKAVPKEIVELINLLTCNSSLAAQGTVRQSSPLTALMLNSQKNKEVTCATEVWTCGQNSYGELGHGDVTLRKDFCKVNAFDNITICSIGAGNEHSVFVTRQGKTYVSGYNDNGQCGMGTTQQVRQPTQVPFLSNEDIVSVHAYNGCEHTIVVNGDGRAFSFGHNYKGQLGLGSTTSETIPRPLKGMMSKKIALVACSYHHSILTCTDNTIYSFGRNDCGQLGHNDLIDKKIPQLVTHIPSHTEIKSIACGQFHSILVGRCGTVMIAGKNDYGQLGLAASETNIKIFSILSTAVDFEHIIQVCCGYYHTLLLSQTGCVYGFGRNDYGQLGLGHVQPRMFGRHSIASLRDKNVLSVACGCYHSAAITCNGMLYVFGRNNHGQLGTGDLEEKHYPHPVDNFIGKNIVQIAAGFYHTLVLTSSHPMMHDGGPPGPLSLSSDGSALLPKFINRVSISDQKNEMCNIKKLPLDKGESQDNANKVDGTGHSKTASSSSNSVQIRDLMLILMNHLETSSLGIILSSNSYSTTPNMVQGENSNQQQFHVHFDMSTDVGLLCCMKWSSLYLRSMSVMLQITRKSVSGQLSIDLPFNPDETARILCVMIQLADDFFKIMKRDNVMKLCKVFTEIESAYDEVNYNEILSIQSPSTYTILSSHDIVQSLLTLQTNISNDSFKASAEMEDSSSKYNTDMAHYKCAFRKNLVFLRNELLSVYFLLPESGIGIYASLIQLTSNCISRHFDSFFWNFSSRCSFLKYLSETLVSGDHNETDLYDTGISHASSAELDASINSCVSQSYELSKGIRLFIRVCSKYQNINEVIVLFQETYLYSFEIYFYILSVYAYLSKIKLENKYMAASSVVTNTLSTTSDSIPSSFTIGVTNAQSHNIEFIKLFNTLEFCCIYFSKIGIPIFYSVQDVLDPTLALKAASSGIDLSCHNNNSLHSAGVNNGGEGIALLIRKIINIIYTNSEYVIDYLSTQVVTDELLEILRSGTILSSVLPIFSLYSLSYVDVGSIYYDLGGPTFSLLSKLHSFITYSNTEINSKTISGGNTTSSSKTKRKLNDNNVDPNSSNALTRMDSSKLHEIAVLPSNNSTVSLFSKKENSQIAPWQKLCKLIIMLYSKLSCAPLTQSYKDMFSRIRYHQIGGILQKPANILNNSICTNEIWRILCGPADSSPFLYLPMISKLFDKYDSITITKVKSICAVLRAKEVTLNQTYSTILRAARASKTLDSIEEFEAIMMATVMDSLDYMRQIVFHDGLIDHPYDITFSKIWNEISKITQSIVSKRSSILSKTSSDILWRDILKFVVSVANGLGVFLCSCTKYVEVNVPLRLPCSKYSRLWRKAIGVILCINRWKSCVKHKYKSHSDTIVKFFELIFTEIILNRNRYTSKHITLSSANFENTWTNVIFVLDTCDHYVHVKSRGLLALSDLLVDNVNSASSAKVDMISVLNLAWKESALDEDSLMSKSPAQSSCKYVTCSSSAQLKISLQSLLYTVLNSLLSFCKTLKQGFACSATVAPLVDINLFCLNANFFQLYVRDNLLQHNCIINMPLLIVELQSALVALDVVLVEFQSVDEKTNAAKRTVARERCSYLRRAANVVVSLLQSITFRVSDTSIFEKNTLNLEYQLLHCHNAILEQLQNSRQEVAKSESALSFPGDGANNKQDSKNSSKDSSRRRCQELINAPMQFTRSQEGFIIQGEKLLSNFKGIDFTITCWIFLSKKTTAKYSFIAGKVSHNDAWPLITHRGVDGKIEIIFGRATEFERLTSTAAIPLYTWVHVAVVVDPRKIKLFINGMIDCQVTTAGNARAILYPVIIGSCPQGVRTRVDHIREGFDGLMARLKYYTRALSPIHVRVIYDHGPPEAHDARERWSYQLLASSKILLHQSCCVDNKNILINLASTMHRLLLSDSARLRYGALQILELILSADIIDKIYLSSKEDSKDEHSSVHFTRESIHKLDIFHEVTSFHAKFVLYILRVIGACWIPTLARDCSDNMATTTMTAKVMQLLQYCPVFVGQMPDEHCLVSTVSSSEEGTSSASSPGSIETSVCREDLVLDLSQSLMSMVLRLSEIVVWRSAISEVLCLCLYKKSSTLNQSYSICTSSNNLLDVIDIVGSSVVIGGFPRRPILGGVVDSFYLNSSGNVLNIDSTTNQCMVLSPSKCIPNEFEFTTLKLFDVDGSSPREHMLYTEESFTTKIYDILESYLVDATKVMMSDLMALNRPEHSFMKSHVIKFTFPLELFVYHQFIRYITKSIQGCDLLHLFQSRPSLFSSLLQTCFRAYPITFNTAPHELFSSERSLPGSWMKCSHFLSQAHSDLKMSSFPLDDNETIFTDYVTKHLGVVAEAFSGQQSSLLRAGLLSELIYSISSASNVSEETNQHNICVSDKYEARCEPLFAVGTVEESNDQSILHVLRFVHQTRQLIIQLCRELFMSSNMNFDVYSSINLKSQVLLWQMVAYECSVSSNDCGSLMEMMTKFLAQSHSFTVTHSLLCCIRYAAISFFQLGTNKRCKGLNSNVFESTDILHRFLQSCYSWLRFHANTGEETNLCTNILKTLLPALSFIESANVELHVVGICVLALQKMLTRFFSGWAPSSDLLDLCRSNAFLVLWTRAQECLISERGCISVTSSTLTKSLLYLATGFVIIQNSTTRTTYGQPAQSNVYSLSPRTPRLQSRSQDIPKAPKIIKLSSDCSVEIEIVDAYETSEFEDVREIIFEVELRVVSDGNGEDDALFETIYYGNSTRIIHMGLAGGFLYAIRYRKVRNNEAGAWSWQTEFRTQSGGAPFLFDSNRCGSDILISKDGCVASYTGDDNWSTVLGNYPLTNGVNTWEIKINSSSTAYIFVGIAKSSADLNTFLGGCSNGWGFIGEQALYHGREKVKIYGENFSAGDTIGVMLDYNNGALSFSKNGKPLGIAFDKIYGEMYPAIAFYNAGQEVEIVTDGSRTICPPMLFACSPSVINLDRFSTISDIVYCLNQKVPFSYRILSVISQHLNAWSSGLIIRRQALSGIPIYLSTDNTMLNYLNIKVGDRIRTQYGIVQIVGVAYNRVWFQAKENDDVWFFTKQQILNGRLKGLFQRCTYCMTTYLAPDSEKAVVFDPSILQELLEPARWSCEMDTALVMYAVNRCDSNDVSSPWDITASNICDDYRTIQSLLSRIVLSNPVLSHKWGISGPKRKAVLARLGMLRLINCYLENSLPLLLPSIQMESKPPTKKIGAEEAAPQRVTIKAGDNIVHPFVAYRKQDSDWQKNISKENGDVEWPKISMSWALSTEIQSTSELSLRACRHLIFPQLKMKNFWRILAASAAKVSKTDDDYDYPEDLPQIKLNQFKSFRAKESSELQGIIGQDLIYSSMFSQLWRELRQHPQDKLRISYTHPMDDGQSRAFKVRFEGEGVDDYGGPYRETFQKICEELLLPDPSIKNLSPLMNGNNVFPRPSPISPRGLTTSLSTTAIMHEEAAEISEFKPSIQCFIPLLHPTPNWIATDDCEEKYKYTFHPSSTSLVYLDMFLFLGQLVGIAIRSKITLDLPLASYIWKSVVREPLTEQDLASFDVSACNFIKYLGSISERLKNCSDSLEALASLREEGESVLQDVTWTATLSNGETVELIANGAATYVRLDDLEEFLRIYVEVRLNESAKAINAFYKGLLSVIPESALSILSSGDIERIVNGSRIIDIERLKLNTEYDEDVSADDSHIVTFWEVLSEFSEEDKSLFLRFVWARPTLPPKDVEFPQKLKIQSAVGEDSNLKPDQYLPKAHTCFFSINLPRYTSKDVMAEKLRYAICNCTEMDADFRVAEPDVAGWNSTQTPQNWSNISNTD